MKRYAVYGVDTVNSLQQFDDFDDALRFARKGLRKWQKTIKDTASHRTIYRVWKNNNNEIVEKDLR